MVLGNERAFVSVDRRYPRHVLPPPCSWSFTGRSAERRCSPVTAEGGAPREGLTGGVRRSHPPSPERPRGAGPMRRLMPS